jgi:hypothetical protein
MIPLNHPAKATIIRNLFDRIAMDISGGFPESKNGYTKILIIVEYLSKLIKVYALKTKSAEEIAEKLWLWITTYGPPKEILTDQGTEFLNNVIEKMINKIGVERRITSPYSPWVDGMAEKAGHSIVSALRKHAETDHLNWDLWLPHVEYSYNTRQHSVTKFAPLEIIQGITPNSLTKNYKDYMYSTEEEAIYQRSLQINNFVERIRPDAIKNIEDAQERQKDIQNKRTKPTEITLKKGTPVMLKVEGLRGKLENRYRGRYFVKEQTSGGNYKLENALGEELKQSFPISKLKPFIEDNNKPEDSVEIEAILDKRKNEDDIIEYLVKWKNLSDDENEWVPEDHFDDVKIINDFNSKLYRNNEQEEITTPVDTNRYNLRRRNNTNNNEKQELITRGRGRPRRTLISPLNVTILLALIANFLSIVGCTTVLDKFTYCDKSTNTLVDLNSCKIKKQSTKVSMIDRSVFNKAVYGKGYTQTNNNTVIHGKVSAFGAEFYPLLKLKDTVFGSAYECRISELKAILKSDFWNNKLPPIKTTITLDITPELCWKLIETKSCEIGEELICEQTGCYSRDPDYSNMYAWWSEKVITTQKCSYTTREITAHSIDVPLFGNDNCKVLNEFCKLSDTIIVWKSKEVIHNCPYARTKDVALLLTEQEPNLLQSFLDNVLFDVIAKIEVCDPKINLYQTTEGVYLALVSDIITHPQVVTINDQLDLKNSLILSEIDSARDTEVKLYKELNIRNCISIINTLNLISKIKNNFYFTIKDINNNDIILYIQSHKLYIPNCKIINEIEILETNLCTEDIPITIVDNNITESLYLNSEKILKKDSKMINCISDEFNIIIELQNNTIIRRWFNTTDNKIYIKLENISKTLQQINIINNNLTLLNFKHNEKLIEQINLHEIEHNGLIHEDGRFIKPSSIADKRNTFSSSVKTWLDYINDKWYYIKIILITIAVLLTAFILNYILIKIIYILYTSIQKRNKSKNNKKLNLIKGFLPNENTKRLNLLKRNRSLDSFELDQVTVSMLEKIKDVNMF